MPALLSMAVGGHLTLDSGSAATSGGQTGTPGDMPGDGLTLELGGQVSALPLPLTFLGTIVLAVGFLLPLRRRARPTPDLLWARFGGALAATLVLFTGSALLGHGTVRLPKGLMQSMGTGTGGSGGGNGGIPGNGLSSVGFRTDVVSTAFFALLWVVLVVGIGCLAARRTMLPRSLALSRLRSGRTAGPPCGARTAFGYHGRHGDDAPLHDGTGIRSDRNEHGGQRDGRHDGRAPLGGPLVRTQRIRSGWRVRVRRQPPARAARLTPRPGRAPCTQGRPRPASRNPVNSPASRHKPLPRSRAAPPWLCT
ncbi:streptophobe family protein [Streptomyces sp. NPDC127079]|uniref:streptophobe family protein n=1 Tax=Streptomyces sp. NPDC127079 TaxID=3347132 RepID=UPI003668DCF3